MSIGQDMLCGVAVAVAVAILLSFCLFVSHSDDTLKSAKVLIDVTLKHGTLNFSVTA